MYITMYIICSRARRRKRIIAEGWTRTSTPLREGESGSPIAWFPDGRRVLVQDKNGLMTVDVETRKTQLVLDKLGHGVQSAALARDGRSLLAVRNDVQADIWMLGAQENTTDTPAGR